MKNKNGFTLIELLAVIVILAVIALIAVPKILGIIETAKKGAAESSALGYIDAVEKQIAVNIVSHKSEIFTIGKITVADLRNKHYVKVNGKEPTAGCVVINEKGIVTNFSLLIDKYVVNKGANERKAIAKLGTEDNLAEICSGNSNTSGATKIEAQIGETHKGIVYLDPSDITKTCDESTTLTSINIGCKKFYIFDDSDDQYKMIMDRNTTSTVAWNSSEENSNHSMGEVLEALENDTEGWNGNPRLITADEIAKAIGSTIWSSQTASQNGGMYFGSKGSSKYSNQSEEHKTIQRSYHWLFDYTNGCIDNGCTIDNTTTKGYWTSSPLANDDYYVWVVYCTGYLGNMDATEDTIYGVRPVITLPKSLID